MFRIRKYGIFIVFGIIIMIGAFLLNRENEDDLEVSGMSENDHDPQSDDSPDPLEGGDEETLDETPEEFAVDIKGAVLDPGVYQVEESARVYDAIELAGGFLKDADENQINLAERVQDEMYVYVPKEGEEDVPNPPVASATGSGTSSDGDRIHVNRASLAELEALNGVGPSKAQAILDHIEENGPLQSIDDMLEINGIGEKTLENFEEQIIVP